MSVTFNIEGLPTGEFTVTCYAQDAVVARTTSYDATAPLIEAHQGECAECAIYRPFAHAVMDIDTEGVNLANTNARFVLGLIGLLDEDGDLCGSVSGEDLLGRTLMALAEDRDESAVPDVAEPMTGGGTFVYCGLPEGYVGMRLRELHDLAREAARLGRDVTWG